MALEAIYEKGTLKLSEQINIEDGTKVQVIIISEDFNSAKNKPLGWFETRNPTKPRLMLGCTSFNPTYKNVKN